MYLPKHFEETRVEVMHALMATHPLGLLVSTGAEGLQANSIPFMVDPSPAPNGTLIAHVARANPLWREAAGTPVLVIFQGPQAYVSPSWYPSKAETERQVPTWNYEVVHAHGRLSVLDDERFVRGLLARQVQSPGG